MRIILGSQHEILCMIKYYIYIRYFEINPNNLCRGSQMYVISSYVLKVVQHFYIDYCIHKWRETLLIVILMDKRKMSYNVDFSVKAKPSLLNKFGANILSYAHFCLKLMYNPRIQSHRGELCSMLQSFGKKGKGY